MHVHVDQYIYMYPTNMITLYVHVRGKERETSTDNDKLSKIRETYKIDQYYGVRAWEQSLLVIFHNICLSSVKMKAKKSSNYSLSLIIVDATLFPRIEFFHNAFV